MSLILIMALAAEAAPAAAPVTVTVANVRSAKGRVHVALCPKEKFLGTACVLESSVPAQPGTITITFPAVPPGDYAAQAFQDENGNQKVDQNFIGMPKEGIGFSRNARVTFGPPKWADAVFAHDARPQAIRFSLRYMLGPDGPEAWAKAHPAR